MGQHREIAETKERSGAHAMSFTVPRARASRSRTSHASQLAVSRLTFSRVAPPGRPSLRKKVLNAVACSPKLVAKIANEEWAYRQRSHLIVTK